MADVQQNSTINFMVPASGGTNVCAIPLPDADTGGADGYTIDWKSLAGFLQGRLFIPQAVTIDASDLDPSVLLTFLIPALAFKRIIGGGAIVTFQFPALQDLVTSIEPSAGSPAFRTFWYDYPAFPDCCGAIVGDQGPPGPTGPAFLVETGSAEKVSDMTAAGALDGSEVVPVLQGGANVQTTAQDIADLATVGQASILMESGSSTKISALTGAGALAGTEPLAIVRSGATQKTTVQSVANLAPATPAILVESGLQAKVSALSAAGALAGTESVPIVQTGATVKTTAQDIANLAPAPTIPAAVLVESGAASKISAMSAAGALAGTETLALVQSGATVKATVQDIANKAALGTLLSSAVAANTVTLTTVTSTDITSITGMDASKRYLVWGLIQINYSAASLGSIAIANSVTANLPSAFDGASSFSTQGPIAAASNPVLSTGAFEITGVTSVFLTARPTFATGTAKGGGILYAQPLN